jgi:hypothetical protein
VAEKGRSAAMFEQYYQYDSLLIFIFSRMLQKKYCNPKEIINNLVSARKANAGVYSKRLNILMYDIGTRCEKFEWAISAS